MATHQLQQCEQTVRSLQRSKHALTDPTSPTVTLTGLERMSRASRSIRPGMVAEKSSVWRSGRIWPTMERTCGSKPRSNMRSASSRTRYVVRRSVAAFIFSMSIRRPCQEDGGAQRAGAMGALKRQRTTVWRP
jgi:hypothetical protein